MKRVVADSNILISALLWGGKPLELIELARSGQIELAVSAAILNETGRVLRDKFNVPDQDIADYREEITRFAIHVTPTEKLDAVAADTTDNPIVECAVAAEARTIVTGDGTSAVAGQLQGH